MRTISSCVKSLLLMALVLFCCIACKQKTPPSEGPKYGAATATNSNQKTYSFSVLPNQTQKMQIEDYLPLTEYLSSQVKTTQIVLDTSKDLPDFEAKIQTRKPDFLIPNPWETLEAMKVGYKVIAMAGSADDFKGLIIVRNDSGINKPLDLKGKSISYPAATALAACIMPQYFLQKQGIKVVSETENRYVGVHSSAILNVYLKQTAAAGASSKTWRNFQADFPTEAKHLKIAWETPPLINNSVMVRKDVPPDILEKVRSLLLKLHETEQGQKILKAIETDRIYSATDSSYEIVRSYVADFERDVRPVKLK